jgi:glyceraldehyde 3-phosphate dehydrogenase
MRVAINGFGRIGRLVTRVIAGTPGVDLVAINDLTDAKMLRHLLIHDSVHGRFHSPVELEGDGLFIAGDKVKVLAEKDPAKLPWKELGVDYVLEATGRFTDREKAALHLDAGAKRVLVTAPGKGVDVTMVLGVNTAAYDPENHFVISNGSCTTNAAAPVVLAIHRKFGIRRGLLTTVHSYTNDQQLLDLAHKDPRRARAAAMSMIPTSTGAAIAIGLVLPELEGRFDGVAIRVPTPNVSLVDFTFELEEHVTAERVNAALREAAVGDLRGIMDYTEEELVSSDFNDTPVSSTVDAKLTRVVADLVKVFAWYDNEWGFSNRCVDVLRMMEKREHA